jgi:hypothetical protein
MLSPTPLLGWGLHTLALLLCSSALGFRELHNAGSLVSENMSSETVRKVSRTGQSPHHQAAHRQVNERLARLGKSLVVLAHPSVVVYPGEGALDYPPAR